MSATFAGQDQLAIMERLSRYAWGYDSNDPAMLLDSFTADASLAMHVAGGGEWGPYLGRESIVEWMMGVMQTQSDQRRHSMTNVVFDEVSETEAVLRCFLVLTAVEHQKVRLVTTGWYRIETVRQEAAWRIRKLDLFLDAPF